MHSIGSWEATSVATLEDGGRTVDPRLGLRQSPRGLRVCPETLGRIAEFSEHEANGGKAQECECLAIEILPIFGEPATAIDPSDRPLDDPAFWYDLEADGIVGSLDDFDMEMRKNFCQGICEFRSLIPTVGKEFLQEWK